MAPFITKIMATPKQEIDLGRYLDIDDVRIDTRRVDRALRMVPELLKTELLDAFDHIRRGFFKALYANTGLRDKRFIATKRVGIGRQLRVYRNPNMGSTLDMQLGIFSRSKIVSKLEKGGTVTAKSGAMVIPLKAARSASGRLSPEFSKFADYRRSFDPSKIKGLFLRKKFGKVFLLRREENDTVRAYFVLKRSITIEPRLRFFDTWDRLEGYRINVLNKSVDKALDKA